MMRYFLIPCFFVFSFFTLFAQDTYQICVKVKGLSTQDPVYLGYYAGQDMIVPIDTAHKDLEGYYVFNGNQKILEGLYAITFSKKYRLDVVIGDKNFSIDTDTTNLISKANIINSPENKAFYAYKSQMSAFDEAQKKGNANKSKLDSVQATKHLYEDIFFRKNNQTFASKILKMTVPNVNLDAKNYSSKAYQYALQHYWDKVDLNDSRLLRTPYFQQKIKEYMDKLTIQQPDSLKKSADLLLSKTMNNQEVFRFALVRLANEYEHPEVAGNESVFVHLVEKYYETGLASWVDAYTLNSLKQKAASLKVSMAGKMMDDFTFSQPNGKKGTLHGIDANYLVVFFYSPNCSHCKKEGPILKQFYEKNKPKGVQVLAMSVREKGDVWNSYINAYGSPQWINGWEEKDESFYYYNYDVTVFPTIYVLDKNKRIIGRKLSAESLENFLASYN